MNALRGDLFTTAFEAQRAGYPYDALCITTNGAIKANGALVMGRGVAGAAAERWPDLPWVLAERVRRNGHVLHVLEDRQFADVKVFKSLSDSPTKYLVAFPTKPVWGVLDGERVQGWKVPSSLDIIEQSAAELADATHSHQWRKVLLPKPGCENGGLTWNQVEPVLSRIFAHKRVLDRIDVIERP